METSYSAVSGYSRVSSTNKDGSEPMRESWRTTWWLVMLSLERHQATMDAQSVSAKRPGLGVEWVILGFTESSQPVSVKREELPPEGFAIVKEGGRKILSLAKSKRQYLNGRNQSSGRGSTKGGAGGAVGINWERRIEEGGVHDHRRCRP
jgi:hypothetical protein